MDSCASINHITLPVAKCLHYSQHLVVMNRPVLLSISKLTTKVSYWQ